MRGTGLPKAMPIVKHRREAECGGRRRSKSEKQGQRVGGGAGRSHTAWLRQVCYGKNAGLGLRPLQGTFKNGLKYMEVPPKMNMIQQFHCWLFIKKN